MLPLRPGSDEFELVKLKVQLAVSNTEMRGLQILAVDNPHVLASFEEHSRGKRTMDAFVDSTSLGPSGQTVDDVAQNGLHFKDSWDCHVGHIDLDRSQTGAHREMVRREEDVGGGEEAGGCSGR